MNRKYPVETIIYIEEIGIIIVLVGIFEQNVLSERAMLVVYISAGIGLVIGLIVNKLYNNILNSLIYEITEASK
ncbi:MAG: hypothetical protein ACRCX4_15280 [Bacteroidales bacterium]